MCRMGRVVVLGSINMDLVVRVPTLPRPGETVLGDRLARVHGGKGANQAVAAARLGAQVSMIGRVGADPFGSELIDGLQQDHVDTAGVAVDRSEPTGAALIVVESCGQNQITVAPGANAHVGEDAVATLRRCTAPGDVVVLQLEVPLPTVLAAVDAGRRAGARVLLNAAPSSALHGGPVPAVDVLVVNESEAAELGGTALGDAVGALVVTLGARGALVTEKGHETPIEPRVVDAVDATGAGDALAGAVAFALAGGATLVEAVRLGCAAGAAAATAFGARPSLPFPDDLKRLFGIELDPRRMTA